VDIPTDLLPIDEATAEHYGERVSHFSMRRWIAKGLGKPPVKLRALRLGGRLFTRPCWVEEFKKATANPDLYRRATKAERVEKAKKRLVRAGA
jgi:hypothetical protein